MNPQHPSDPSRRHFHRLLYFGLLAFSSFAAAAEIEDHTIVISGTYHWKIGDPSAKQKKGDFWWEIVSPEASNLVPMDGVKAAVVTTAYDNMTAAKAKSAQPSNKPISRKTLRPGTSVVFKTSKGRTGIFKVVRYLPLAGHAEEYDLEAQWRWL